MKIKPVAELKNIGKTVAQKLAEIDITNSEQLAVLGAAGAYQKLSKKYPHKHFPVCYYLYSLEGALKNKHWDDLSDNQKYRLRMQAGIEK